MKISQLIRQLEEARDFLGSDAEVVFRDPTSRCFAIHEVWSDKGLGDGEPIVVAQTYIVKGKAS